MKQIIVSFSSLPTITQGTSPTHRPIFAYRKPFRIAICFVIDVEIKFHARCKCQQIINMKCHRTRGYAHTSNSQSLADTNRLSQSLCIIHRQTGQGAPPDS